MRLDRVVSGFSQLQIHCVKDGKDEVSPELEEEYGADWLFG